MEVKALQQATLDLLILNPLITHYAYSENEVPSKEEEALIWKLMRKLYDHSIAIGAEIVINNVLAPERLPNYFKEVKRIIKNQDNNSRKNYQERDDSWNQSPDFNSLMLHYIDYSDIFIGNLLGFTGQYVLENSNSEQIENDIDRDNVYALTDIFPKLIYLYYSGAIDGLQNKLIEEKGKYTDAELSISIAHILNTKPSYIKTLLSRLRAANIEHTNNTPYNYKSVKEAIKCLNEAGIDTNWLYENVYMKLEERERKSKRK